MTAATSPQSAAGTTLAASASLPATYDNTGFSALTFVPVSQVVDLGEFGKEYNLISFNSLGQRAQGKLKGSYNNGSISMQLHRVISNAGQALLKTAAASDASYSFVVTIQDGTKFYFTAKVMSNTVKVGSVDNILGATVKLEIDSDVVEV